MTDIAVDDPTLGQLASDIRVFGKWSGAEVQISDMSLEVGIPIFMAKIIIRSF